MIGQTLGHYRIVEKLGAGGMGEVYRAHDTRLDRDVALKILPDLFARDAERLARFEREAQLLASLSHPNIAAVYGVEDSSGVPGLVMELVEGQTLAERLRRRAIPSEEALAMARQIGEAVEAAHERGIIHRDLKPSNVKITPAGQVKLLDFGLAKALEGETKENISNSSTLTNAAGGAILLGTPAYMSPEQALGKRADKRADIWAFGCVLYEMLTGRRAFSSETISDTLTAVVRAEPDWSPLPAETPPRIRHLLRQCLEKNPRGRLQAIGDARITIEEVLSGSAAAETTAEVAGALPRWHRALPWVLAGMGLIVGGLATGLLVWNPRPRPTPPAISRFALTLPAGESLIDFPAVAISPDGTALAYVAGPGDTTQLYLRPMDRLEASPLPGTQGAATPFFSPDGQWIAFFARGQLKKISVHGGAPETLCNAQVNRGASWGPDETIIFAPTTLSGLMRIPAAGGTPQVLTTPDASKSERTHRWPEILPGGKAVLFTIGDMNSSEYYFDAKIAVQRLDTGERKILPVTGSFAQYAPSGHLVFARAEGLFAAPFDLKRLEVTGPPVPVLQDIASEIQTGAAHFSLSQEGSLVYVPGSSARTRFVLAWVNRKGAVELLPAPQRLYHEPHLSPDGERVAVSMSGERSRDIWVYEIASGGLIRLTFGEGDSTSPVWAPDGKRIAFTPARSGAWTILLKPADGSGPEETLVPAQSHALVPESWSPDGKFLAYTASDPTTRGDIWILPLDGDRKPRPFLRTKFDELAPRFSPNGRWIAYASDESGRNEVYVQPFPRAGGKWQVSTDGGNWPVWARNSRELFYLNSTKLMSVTVATQPSFSASPPRFVADLAAVFPGRLGNGVYDVSPDGQRFVTVQPNREPARATEVRVVLHWVEELKRLAPASNKP